MATFLRHKRSKLIAFLCFASIYFLLMNSYRAPKPQKPAQPSPSEVTLYQTKLKPRGDIKFISDKDDCATANCPSRPCGVSRDLKSKSFKDLSKHGHFLSVCGYNFMFSREKTTWRKARDGCCALGMELAVFRVKELQTCLSSAITKYTETPFYKSIGSDAFWTSGREGKCASGGEFAWCGQNGEFRKSDLQWAPASKEGGGCLLLRRGSRNESLIDKANCNATNNFVCMFRETDQYQENHVERECRKMQKIDFADMKYIADVFSHEDKITYNMKCFVKCAAVMVDSFPPSTFLANIYDEKFMFRFFGGFRDGIDANAINRTVVECAKNFGNVTNECVQAYEYYKCALKSNRKMLLKIIDKKQPTIDLSYSPPLKCSPFVRQCIMSRKVVCKTNEELKASDKMTKGEMVTLVDAASKSNRTVFLSNYEESINEADAYRYCCNLGMKLFEPRSVNESNGMKALLETKDKKKVAKGVTVLMGEVQQESHEAGSWCSSKKKVPSEFAALNAIPPTTRCIPYLDALLVDATGVTIVQLNRKNYYLDFDMLFKDTKGAQQINYFACE